MRRRILLFGVALFLLVGIGVGAHRTIAQKLPPRWREESIVETVYTWWLLPWSNPQHVACILPVNHPESPTPDDVYRFCGWDIYREWRATPPCPAAVQGGDVTACKGYYLHFVGKETVSHNIIHVYPLPKVHLALENCTPELPHFRCPGVATVHISAEEPLPGARITQIQIFVFGQGNITCAGAECDVPLQASDRQAVRSLRIIAVSSAPQSNRSVSAKVRLTPQDDGTVLADVISPAWDQRGADMCARTWEAMPPIDGLPDWARTPQTPDGLATDAPYVYLAGRLIANRVVDASDCPDGGLRPDGTANACGLGLARDAVKAWQNRFDPQILDAAQKIGIPAVLFKRLIARESQFWPAEYPEIHEVGFGQLSPNGMDTLLLWDPDLFLPMCRSMLGAWKCIHGYGGLSQQQKNLLYGSLWVQADLTCADCPYGIDYQRIPNSLELFARLIRANCRQMGQAVRNITLRSPGDVASYADLWRFTIAGYNCPDCIYEALLRTYNSKDKNGRREPLDWEHVSQHFPKGCEATLEYTESILPP